MSAKYEQLAAILRSEARQILFQGGNRLPTEAEISARYHMSRQTVRHALKQLEEEGVIQRRQGSGSYLLAQNAADDPKQIAVVTTFLDDYIFPTILHDAQNSFAQAGYSTLVFTTENQVGREREILTQLLEQNISAVLMEGSKTALPTPNSDLYQLLHGKGTPILFLHGVYGNLSGFPCLMDDNFSGGYMLTRYLLDKGHRNISGIFKSDDLQGPQRYHGVISALRDSGIAIRDGAFSWYDTEDRAALVNNSGCDFLNAFISRRLANASAVICYNDEIAHFLIRRLLETGRIVPDDVAVASFDNSFYSQIGPVPITTLGHRTSRTGKAAAAMLLDILSGGHPQSRFLEWELYCRGSA